MRKIFNSVMLITSTFLAIFNLVNGKEVTAVWWLILALWNYIDLFVVQEEKQ